MSSKRERIVYKIGEEIANGVKYFGQEKVINGYAHAMCICPECGELWNASLSNVRIGKSTSCCGSNKHKNKNENKRKEFEEKRK